MTTRVWTFNNPELATPEDIVVAETLDEYLNPGKRPHFEFVYDKLLNEWGWPATMKEMRQMTENSGNTSYVFRFPKNGTLTGPAVVLRSLLANVDGDFQELLEQYPTYAHAIAKLLEGSNDMQ